MKPMALLSIFGSHLKTNSVVHFPTSYLPPQIGPWRGAFWGPFREVFTPIDK
jgi:hypothetical protein